MILRLDYALVAVFVLMFVDFRALSDILARFGLMSLITSKLLLFYYAVLLSQIVSNVPATIMLLSYTRD